MNVKNCKRCKRLFNYITGSQLCPACKKELDEIFLKIKDYVRDNPNVSVHDITREFKVSELQVKEWIREERLVFSEPTTSGIFCEICNKPIVTGRFCEECKKNTLNSFNDLLPKEEPKKPAVKEREKARMRFLK